MNPRPAFTRISRKQPRPRRQGTISSTTSPQPSADTPTTATTRPLYVGTGHDVSAAVDALDEAERPWSSSVAVPESELSDFTPERRWTSVLLGALGILALATLVVAVIGVANSSSGPAREAPPPPVPSTAAVTTTAATPSPSAAPRPSGAAAQPPAYSSVTATASTVVAPPPPAVQPDAPGPKPNVRQRLHDLFPRLLPNP